MAGVTAAQLRKQLRTVFTSNDVSFAGLQPSADLVDRIDSFIAHRNINNSQSSLRDEPGLGETLVELSISLPKADSHSRGRLSAWLVVLSKLCLSGCADIQPSQIIGLQAVWQNLLRPVLNPCRVAPNSIFPVSLASVKAAKDLIIWGFGDLPDSESPKMPSLEETIIRDYIELYSVYGPAATSSENVHSVEKGKKHLQDVLLTLGKQRPKNLFAYLATVVPTSVAVRQAYLILISTFVKNFANLSHHMTTVKLLDQLLVCLLVEVDPDIIHLSLSCILITIPRIPTYLADYIPSLFAAYSKLVAFQHDQEQDAIAIRARIESNPGQIPDNTKKIPARPVLRSDLSWTIPPTSPEALPAAPGPAYSARELFTYLYGIVPCNLARFLEAPKAYLNKKDWLSPFAAGLDEPMLRLDQVAAKTDVFLLAHAFQPAVLHSNAITELSTLKTKWAKMDAATVIDECERLHIIRPIAPTMVEGVSASSRGRGRFAHRSGDSAGTHSPEYTPRRGSLTRGTSRSASISAVASLAESRYEAEAAATPAVNGYISPPSTSPSPADFDKTFVPVTKQKSRSPGYFPFDSSTSMATLSRALTSSAPLSSPSTEASKDLIVKLEKAAQLSVLREKEINMLRAELQHELYLKGQHLQQMGAIHRHSIAEKAGDADRNSLYQAKKHLTSRLVEKQAQVDKLRQEATANRAAYKIWQEDLRSKVQELQNERITLRNDMELARQDAQDAQRKFTAQSTELETLGARVFDLEAQEALNQPKIAKLHEYEQTIEKITFSLLLWDKDVARLKQLSTENEVLISQCHSAREFSERAQEDAMAAHKQLETEQEKTRKLTDSIDNLRRQLSALEPGAIPPSLANTSYEQLRTNYERLRDRCIKLEQFRLEQLGEQSTATNGQSPVNGDAPSSSSEVSA